MPKPNPAPSTHTGISLHLGLNSVDPKHYGGWSGDLVACEFDANDMAAIATNAGMNGSTLLTRGATRKKVLAAIRDAQMRGNERAQTEMARIAEEMGLPPGMSLPG